MRSTLDRHNPRGFTLVEILIVVIILGILAAVVIPQFSNASQDARRSGVSSQLQTLRSQIEMYKLQHMDRLPELLTNWDQLTLRTDVNGGTSGTIAFGPYLQKIPKNPLNGHSTVTQSGTLDTRGIPANASSACGFVYDFSSGTGTGKLWATDSTGTAVYVE